MKVSKIDLGKNVENIIELQKNVESKNPSEANVEKGRKSSVNCLRVKNLRLEFNSPNLTQPNLT